MVPFYLDGHAVYLYIKQYEKKKKKNDIIIAVSIPNQVGAGLDGSVVPSDRRPGGRGFNPRQGRQNSFMEIDHEIFSTVILSLPLKKGSCQFLVKECAEYWLTA